MYQLTKTQATLELEGQRLASLRCLGSRVLAGSLMKLMNLSPKKKQERSNVADEGYVVGHCEELSRRAAEKILLAEAATFNGPSETLHKQTQKVETKWTYY